MKMQKDLFTVFVYGNKRNPNNCVVIMTTEYDLWELNLGERGGLKRIHQQAKALER